jgi:hypothetical protein
MLCIAAFLANHCFSFRYHLREDLERTRNLGSLMFFPYARILPMHLTIIFGGFIAFRFAAVLLFLLLKTLADLAMHAVEHQWRRDPPAPRGAARSSPISDA